MLSSLTGRKFGVISFILWTLWVAVIVVPLLYGIVFPARDFRQIIEALKLQGASPVQAAGPVQQVITVAGPLRRAVRVGSYSAVGVMLQENEKHVVKRTEASYAAWFQKIHKPILLLLERFERDGVLQGYVIKQGQPNVLIRNSGLPFVLFGFSLYMMRKSAHCLPDHPSY
jgi:hypothetical protein